ncbi:hypothetical protein V1282_001968 [Nitrobacteraceae bacterium AZCC 2146]
MSVFPNGLFLIYLTELNEPVENSLRVIVAEAKTDDRTKSDTIIASSITPIVITPDSRRFEFVWKSYVAYSVRDETVAQHDKDRPPVSSTFLERRSSAYLRFLEETTFAAAIAQRPIKHWEINCLNHCIDVVSSEEPEIRQILSDVGTTAKYN